MRLTICGLMDGWDVTRCRTVSIAQAQAAWGPYFPAIMQTNDRMRFKVGPYQVWISRREVGIEL